MFETLKQIDKVLGGLGLQRNRKHLTQLNVTKFYSQVFPNIDHSGKDARIVLVTSNRA